MKPAGRSPDTENLTEQLAALSPEKRKLLQQRLRARLSQTIQARKDATSAPLSFAQQRLWFFDQLEPGNSTYNMPCAFRAAGRLVVPALEKSLNEIIRRHAVLRTTFVSAEGDPTQIIAPQWRLTLEHADLRELPETDRETQALQVVAEEIQRPFRLETAPPIRAKLLRLGDDDHIVVLTLHHIASDGWSMAILLGELAELYNAFSAGMDSPLPELAIQYADFAVWQRQWLGGKVLEDQLAYWTKQLADVATLEFPTDCVRSAVQTFAGAGESVVISAPVTGRLRAVAQENRATLFMVLLAGFNVLLQWYTRQDDIVVGSPIAGRTRQETEPLIGFFINNLVLRNDLSGNPTFRELLERVRMVALNAYAHQELPFEKLVEELHPKRDLSRAPLFQVFLNLLELDVPQLQLRDLTVKRLTPTRAESKFDFTFYVRERNQELCLELVYNTALFRKETATRLIGHFHALLERIALDPDRRISALPMVAESERRQLLVDWNDTAKSYSASACMHQLFEAQVERTPESVALLFDGAVLSYGELNRRANCLAHYLRRRGVGPESRIGLCLERSFEMVVGMLGILKAGGAYVPLDPSYPKDRITFILDDSGVNLVLTQGGLSAVLSAATGSTGVEGIEDGDSLSSAVHRGIHFVCLDADWERIAQESEKNPSVETTPDNLAYVIYTSGSTGRPKGVLSRHRGAVNYFQYLIDTYGIAPADTVLQIPSMSFDASVRDIVGSLVWGARVVLVGNTIAKEPEALLAKIREHRVTCLLSIGPTMLSGMVEIGGVERLPHDSVRLILASGDVLHLSLCERARDVFTRAVVINQYGPTETTMTATYQPIQGHPNGRSTALIGKPIQNVQLFILNGDLNLAPIGALGELHIGGIGLGRGYQNRADLTAEKFIPHPFAQEAGARLYKTGDLARWLADGTLEFFGRIDNQVKIRDFRIELGEVEAVLMQHDAVRRAVTMVREESPGNKRLVAYIVPEPGQALATSDLLRFAKSKLPDYMVPSAFVVLKVLPLTPNGKVDRKALPAPDDNRAGIAAAYLAPQNATEERIAEIWAMVLGVSRIGIRDEFFELGGHSLLATQVVSRIRRAFKIELPLRSLFDHSTVEELALHITQIQAEKAAPEEIATVLADLDTMSDTDAEDLAKHYGRRS